MAEGNRLLEMTGEKQHTKERDQNICIISLTLYDKGA
jgi:hypothetical protein